MLPIQAVLQYQTSCKKRPLASATVQPLCRSPASQHCASPSVEEVHGTHFQEMISSFLANYTAHLPRVVVRRPLVTACNLIEIRFLSSFQGETCTPVTPTDLGSSHHCSSPGNSLDPSANNSSIRASSIVPFPTSIRAPTCSQFLIDAYSSRLMVTCCLSE